MMDWFFYWGQMSLDDEVREDIRAVVIQPRKSIFYDRSYGSAVGEAENSGSQLVKQIGARYSAVQAIALRNGRVTDGTNGPDRRVLTSQAIIGIEDTENGFNLEVYYTPMSGTRRVQKVVAPIGGMS
jgi:hypothetical protein